MAAFAHPGIGDAQGQLDATGTAAEVGKHGKGSNFGSMVKLENTVTNFQNIPIFRYDYSVL